MEQPDAIERTITNRITSGMPDFTADGVPDEIFTQCERVNIIACGTAMHAGLVAQALIKSILHMHIDVDMASEFMYSDPVIDEKSLVIAVSQSGETIDTLEAVKYAKKRGAKCLSIINVKDLPLRVRVIMCSIPTQDRRSPLQVPRHTRHSLLYFI